LGALNRLPDLLFEAGEALVDRLATLAPLQQLRTPLAQAGAIGDRAGGQRVAQIRETSLSPLRRFGRALCFFRHGYLGWEASGCMSITSCREAVESDADLSTALGRISLLRIRSDGPAKRRPIC
jgi:hypothetical protein